MPPDRACRTGGRHSGGGVRGDGYPRGWSTPQGATSREVELATSSRSGSDEPSLPQERLQINRICENERREASGRFRIRPPACRTGPILTQWAPGRRGRAQRIPRERPVTIPSSPEIRSPHTGWSKRALRPFSPRPATLMGARSFLFPSVSPSRAGKVYHRPG